MEMVRGNGRREYIRSIIVVFAPTKGSKCDAGAIEQGRPAGSAKVNVHEGNVMHDGGRDTCHDQEDRGGQQQECADVVEEACSGHFECISSSLLSFCLFFCWYKVVVGWFLWSAAGIDDE